MSRSYKHTPIGKAKSRFSQKQAARKIRRNKLEYIPDGRYYKRTYSMWEVIDYTWYCPFSYWMDNFSNSRFSKRNVSYKNSPEEEKIKKYNEWKKRFLTK